MKNPFEELIWPEGGIGIAVPLNSVRAGSRHY